MAVLDLGCGASPHGDVNVDFYLNDVGHRTGEKEHMGLDVSPKVKNLVKWDLNVYPYPFGNGSFSEVYSRHTIEHLDNPFRFLSECVRISSDKVTVICPHGLGERITEFKRNPYHKSWLSRRWFTEAAEKLSCSCQTRITTYSGFNVHGIKILQIPTEVTAELHHIVKWNEIGWDLDRDNNIVSYGRYGNSSDLEIRVFKNPNQNKKELLL